SDAGTPSVSDPGAELVHIVRTRIPTLQIFAVPGPSALTALLSIAGVVESDFTFLGFLPHKKGRETLFKEIATAKRAVVFYESTHRILKTLESLANVLTLERRVVIGRELTKKFEEVISGTAQEALDAVKSSTDRQKGEFVVLVAP